MNVIRQINQKIIVVLSLDDMDKNLIMNGIRLALLFRKDLCLMVHSERSSKKELSQNPEKLSETALDIQSRVTNLNVSTLVLTGKIRNIPAQIADEHEGILFIAASADYPKFEKALHESPIPFLFVNNHSEIYSEFKKIVLPVDLRKAVTECAIWGTYFGKFNQSEIVLFFAHDNDNDNKRLVYKNLQQIQTFYQKSKIDFRLERGIKTSMGNGFEALEYSKSQNSDLLIIAGSTYISMLDRIIGLPEQKIIKNAGPIPVLVINPRIENYMLCEDCG